MQLEGKVFAVTGGGNGIGREVVLGLLRAGSRVAALDLSAEGLAATVAEAEAEGSAAMLTTHPVDVTQRDAVSTLPEQVVTAHGAVDGLVNVAGIIQPFVTVDALTPEQIEKVMNVNFWGVVNTCQAFLPHLRAHGEGGHIVNVASIAGIAGNRGQTNYAASKAGVIGMTRALATDPQVIAKGVTVNAVAPGFIETEMTAKVPFATREAGRLMNSLSQGGKPVDVAETIGFFAWDSNRGVTGNTVRVCGQMLLGA